MCSICDGEGCIYCDPNPENIDWSNLESFLNEGEDIE